MAKVIPELKSLTIRIPKEIWMFLKRTAADQEESMTDIIVRCVDKYKKKIDAKSVREDTNI